MKKFLREMFVCMIVALIVGASWMGIFLWAMAGK
jgi:hypothetical protein